jgi:hypothetical protein
MFGSARFRARRVGAFMLLFCPALAVAEAQTPATPVREISGLVTFTNKGISLVPALTLGRPAMIFDLSARRDRLSFDPQFRFDADGTPWSFLLWARYRVIQGERFRLTAGGHPSVSFRRIDATTGDESRGVIQARRYLAGELSQSYALTRNVSIGGYYLYSHGVDPGLAPHTNFISARGTISNVPLPLDLRLQVAPQFYYLRTNGLGGLYVNAGTSLSRPGVPFALLTSVNQPLRSDVPGGQDFLWNVSVSYAFR